MEEKYERKYNERKKPVLPWVIAVIVLLLIGAVTAVILYARVPLELKLLGDGEITLEYGGSFTDQGAVVLLDGQEVAAEITVDQPRMDAPGTYTVTYSVTYRLKAATARRTVHIVDTQPPVITLLTDPGYYLEIGSEYREEGFTAVDNYDGDLTEQVTRTITDDTVTYTVTDSSGNTASVQRQLTYGDHTAPVITLTGGDTVTVKAGSIYEEPGCTATDNADGDISANVTVTGEYDTYIPGTYTFTYTVTDAHGNTAEAIRTLIVEALVQPEEPETAPDKVIYLTFDDGPGAYTPELLATLEKYNVKVTFFVVGTAHLEYLDDIAAAGHSIGIHTNTHVYSRIYASETAFFQDFNAIHDKILSYTGIDTKLSRFPGGSSNNISKQYCTGIMSKLVKEVAARGYHYFDWNVDSNDAGGATTAEEVYENVISGIQGKKAAIVLQHDIKDFSVDAVEKIIQWGLANGYTFLPLTEDSPTAHHRVNN